MPLTLDYRETPFLEGTVGIDLNRLNWRAEMILARNQHLIEGKRVLDIASHDGRFSYACLKLGAKHVTGVEGRQHLVDKAHARCAAMGCDPARYQFSVGDAFDALPRFRSGTFDTILCFGFFYHTIRQVEMMREFQRLDPQAVLLDSTVERERLGIRLALFLARLRPRHVNPAAALRLWRSTEGDEVLRLRSEDAGHDANTIESAGRARREDELRFRQMGVTFYPTASLVERLFEVHGFQPQRIDWHSGEIRDWTAIEDYKNGGRFSWVATRR